jgi:atypical dual specificity phosphatase
MKVKASIKPKLTGMKGKWLKFSKFNGFVKETSIFPAKSPHNKDYAERLKTDQTFYLKDLVDHLLKQGRPLKALIDLSEGTHYTKDDLKEFSIDYYKISIKGKSFPDIKTKSAIFEIINKYNSKNETICIHCKHGLNRTGYIIVSYLIEIQRVENKEAILRFEEARGLKIENKKYVENLLKLKPCDENEKSEELKEEK